MSMMGTILYMVLKVSPNITPIPFIHMMARTNASKLIIVSKIER